MEQLWSVLQAPCHNNKVQVTFIVVIISTIRHQHGTTMLLLS